MPTASPSPTPLRDRGPSRPREGLRGAGREREGGEGVPVGGAVRAGPSRRGRRPRTPRSRGLTDEQEGTGNHGNLGTNEDPGAGAGRGPAEDRGRRLLFVLLGILVLGAVALLVLLFWLLRPEASPTRARPRAAIRSRSSRRSTGTARSRTSWCARPSASRSTPTGTSGSRTPASPASSSTPRTARTSARSAPTAPASCTRPTGWPSTRNTGASTSPTTAAERSRCSRPRAGT